MLQLVKNSRQTIQSMLQRFPVTNKERLELLPKTDKNQVNEGKNSRFHLVRPVVTLNTIFILLPYFLAIIQRIFPSKAIQKVLDLSYKLDLDLLDCFVQKNSYNSRISSD